MRPSGELAAISPPLAIAHFAGRPLLMLNGEDDPIITPEMGQRLFDAAAEAKELKWYDCGHLLTEQAYKDAARWAAAQMNGEDPKGKDDGDEPAGGKKSKNKKKAKKKVRR